MKAKLISTVLTIFLLFIMGCTSDDGIEVQHLSQDDPQYMKHDINELTKTELSNYYESKLKVAFKKGGGKDPKPYWEAEYSNFYSNQGDRVGPFLIPGTSLLIIYDYPINGEDRIHVNGDYGHMTWNLKEPYVWVIDLSTGNFVYSNICSEKRTGFFKETLSGFVYQQDLDGDGEIDIWQIRGNDIESNGMVHVKTSLTDAQEGISAFPYVPEVWYGECGDSSNEVGLVFQGFVKNGNFLLKFKLGSENYEEEVINHP